MREILSPFEFFCWQVAGYGVFAIAAMLIPIAIAQGVSELRPQRLARRRVRSASASSANTIPFPVRTGRVLAFPVTRKAVPHA